MAEKPQADSMQVSISPKGMSRFSEPLAELMGRKPNQELLALTEETGLVETQPDNWSKWAPRLVVVLIMQMFLMGACCLLFVPAFKRRFNTQMKALHPDISEAPACSEFQCSLMKMFNSSASKAVVTVIAAFVILLSLCVFGILYKVSALPFLRPSFFRFAIAIYSMSIVAMAVLIAAENMRG